jgi:FlaA1/EpsC-like NDP-sugar epimerase
LKSFDAHRHGTAISAFQLLKIIIMNRLQGKVAIVTGGATGIGEAICKKFSREGVRLL